MIKQSFLILFILILFSACNSKEEKSSVKQDNNNENLTDSIVYDTLEGEPELTYPDEYDVKEDSVLENGHVLIKDPFDRIMGNYIALSYKEGEPLIYHFCEAEDPSVVIDEYEGEKRFIVAMGQDSDMYTISSIEGETYEKELYQVAEYKIELSKYYGNDVNLTVTALINEDDGTSFFEGVDNIHSVYIREDFSKDVEQEYENCDYLDDY